MFEYQIPLHLPPPRDRLMDLHQACLIRVKREARSRQSLPTPLHQQILPQPSTQRSSSPPLALPPLHPNPNTTLHIKNPITLNMREIVSLFASFSASTDASKSSVPGTP